MKDGHNVFPIGGISQIFITQLFTSEHQCSTHLHQHDPKKPFKHITLKFLVKLGTTKTRVVHMESFKLENTYYVASFHTKEFLLSRVVNGEKINPLFFTNLL
jgi:hypothetical protein